MQLVRVVAVLVLLVSATVVPEARGDGFVLSNGNFTSITVSGASDTQANAINDAGQVVGFYGNSGGEGFLYGGGVLTTFSAPGGFTDPTGINNSGQIVIDGNNVGYLYSAGTFTTIQFPGASYSEPTGINNNGVIVGVYCMSSCNHLQSFVYNNGTFTTISAPGALDTRVWGINDSGQIVGTSVDATTSSSFLYSGGTFATISVPSASDTEAIGVNDSGEIVGAFNGGTSAEGFLYSGGIFTPINVPGAAYTVAKGINNDGVVVGTYENPPAPVPEPATVTLLLSGMTSLFVMLRRRQAAAHHPCF